jgi:hypothetical protein
MSEVILNPVRRKNNEVRISGVQTVRIAKLFIAIIWNKGFGEWGRIKILVV